MRRFDGWIDAERGRGHPLGTLGFFRNVLSAGGGPSRGWSGVKNGVDTPDYLRKSLFIRFFDDLGLGKPFTSLGEGLGRGKDNAAFNLGFTVDDLRNGSGIGHAQRGLGVYEGREQKGCQERQKNPDTRHQRLHLEKTPLTLYVLY